MISLLEKNGFEELENNFRDLEIGKKDSVGLISLKKSKNNIKEHRISGNRLDDTLIGELKEILAMWRHDDSIKSLILTSSHKVAFSRGAAIEEVLGAESSKSRDFLAEAQDLLLIIQRYPKPIIAAINGLTLGGGFELVLACDMRICGTRENVVFGFPETSLGLIPAMGGTQNLRRIVGMERAKEIISRAAVDITAEKALELGIVSKTTSPSELLKTAFVEARNYKEGKSFVIEQKEPQENSDSLLKAITDYLHETDLMPYRKGRSAPLAGALTNFIYSRTEEEKYLDGLLFEFEVFSFLQQTEDCREGIQAMIEEREPFFKGR